MIKRTLVRMTIWNSTVVFCLLIMLGGALYGLARYRIYSDINRQLVFNIDNMYQTSLNNGEKVTSIDSKDPERFMMVFYWDSNGTLKLAVADSAENLTISRATMVRILSTLMQHDSGTAVSYPLIFLPFISSAFVPTDSMPKVVRAFAENQPVTSIVESIRALLAGQPVGNDLWVALAWCVGIMIVAYIFAMRAYKKRS